MSKCISINCAFSHGHSDWAVMALTPSPRLRLVPNQGSQEPSDGASLRHMIPPLLSRKECPMHLISWVDFRVSCQRWRLILVLLMALRKTGDFNWNRVRGDTSWTPHETLQHRRHLTAQRDEMDCDGQWSSVSCRGNPYKQGCAPVTVRICCIKVRSPDDRAAAAFWN